MAAFFLRAQLILEMHSRRPRFDHRLHQLEDVQSAAESRFGIRYDRHEIIERPDAFRMLDLIGSLQRLIDPLHHARHAVGRVQALVGIHLSRQIRVGGHLPAAEVDGLQPGLYLLHRLIAGQRAERRDVILLLQHAPQLIGPSAGQRMLDQDGASELEDFLR